MDNNRLGPKPLVVKKFVGSPLATPGRMHQVLRLAVSGKLPVLVVLSAVAGVTDIPEPQIVTWTRDCPCNMILRKIKKQKVFGFMKKNK